MQTLYYGGPRINQIGVLLFLSPNALSIFKKTSNCGNLPRQLNAHFGSLSDLLLRVAFSGRFLRQLPEIAHSRSLLCLLPSVDAACWDTDQYRTYDICNGAGQASLMPLMRSQLQVCVAGQ